MRWFLFASYHQGRLRGRAKQHEVYCGLYCFYWWGLPYLGPSGATSKRRPAPWQPDPDRAVHLQACRQGQEFRRLDLRGSEGMKILIWSFVGFLACLFVLFAVADITRHNRLMTQCLSDGIPEYMCRYYTRTR